MIKEEIKLNNKSNIKQKKKNNDKNQLIDFLEFFYSDKTNCECNLSKYNNCNYCQSIIMISHKSNNNFQSKFIQLKKLIEQNQKNVYNIKNQDVYLSIANLYIQFNKNKKPVISDNNISTLNYIVLDVDPIKKNIFSTKDFIKFLYLLKNDDTTSIIPEPHATVYSGNGIHLYFKINKLILSKDTKLKKNQKNLYIDTAKELKKIFSNALEILKYKNPNNDFLQLLKLDNQVGERLTQMIRMPQTYNPSANNYSQILTLNKDLKPYNLSNLITEIKDNKNSIEKELYNLSGKKNILNKKKTINYSNNTNLNKDDIINHKIETQRIEDIVKFAEYKKENNELIGYRNKIYLAIGRCSISRGDTKEITNNICNKLLQIYNYQDEYKETYIQKQYKHLIKNYQKYPKLTNETIKRFLDITEEEATNLNILHSNKKESEKNKRKLKIIRIGKETYNNRRRKKKLTQKQLLKNYNIKDKRTLRKYEEIYKTLRYNKEYNKIEKNLFKDKREYLTFKGLYHNSNKL